MSRSALTFLLSLWLPVFASARPNVIVIVTDDQGYGDMSCHGNPWLKTPNLDRLHDEGVRLEDYHVDPVCTPTRAALMTGRYCTRVGAWTVTEGRQLLNPDETTMAQVFAASGYRTGMFGKWHLGDAYPFAPQHRGFQDVVCHKAGGVDEIGNPKGNSYFDDTYFRDGVPEKFTGYCTNVFFDEALRFIGQAEEKPFFIYLPLNAMHGPHTVAEKYWQRFIALGHAEERAKFFGMIENFDENLGRLLATLKEKHLDQDTILIFMGDNGTAEGGGSDKPGDTDGFNAGMRGKKGSVYEGGHRVACFVRWPGKLTAGREVTQLTAHRDWLPTLIELCDLKAPTDVAFDGVSIAPLLEGRLPSRPETPAAGKPPFQSWTNRTLFIDRQGEQLSKAAVHAGKGKYPQFAVLTEQWRLVNGELYDITSDPSQLKNLAKQHPQVVQELYAAYEAHFDDVNQHQSAYTRFQLGSGDSNPSEFTVRDWHPTEGGVIWRKEQLDDDTLFINGFWAVDVVRAGRYQIRLTRFPQDAEQPMGASAARIKLGQLELVSEVSPDAAAVSFEVSLPKGPFLMQTYLKDAKSGRERGTYHVAVRWMGQE